MFLLPVRHGLDHILLHCSYAKEVWYQSLREANLEVVTPTKEDMLEEWWLILAQDSGIGSGNVSMLELC
jgi:hypothetical protein